MEKNITVGEMIADDILQQLGKTEVAQATVNPQHLKALLPKLAQHRQNLQENIETLRASISSMEQSFFKKTSGMFSRMFTKKETVEQLEQEIASNRELLGTMESQLSECVVKADVIAGDAKREQFSAVADAFSAVCQSRKIWQIVSTASNTEQKSSAATTVNRKEVSFSTGSLAYVRSTLQHMFIGTATGESIYLYPAFVLYNSAGVLKYIPLADLTFSFSGQRFIEPRESIPPDTKIVDQAWAKVNKDGSPDMRFKGNYQTPVVRYGALQFSVQATTYEFYVSHYEHAELFAEKLSEYLSSDKASANGTPFISRAYFDSLLVFSVKFLALLIKLKRQGSLRRVIENSSDLRDISSEGTSGAIELLFQVDLLKCFNSITDLYDFSSKESFAVLYVQACMQGFTVNDYLQLGTLYQPSITEGYARVYDTLQATLSEDPEREDFFKLSYLLKDIDADLQEEYLTTLYQFASIVIKADGTVSEKEEKALKRIMQRRGSTHASTTTAKPVKIQEAPTAQTLEQVMKELNDMIGLSGVKQEVSSLVNFIRIQRAREAQGLKGSQLSYHIVFTGNPGTGKTTVARIIAKIYKSLGVITQGQLVETDRSGLIAEYVGQTAVKTNRIIDSAINGVLFIDEAYAISGESKEDFGKEAVATLIKRMEDDRDKLVVILAGYTEPMQTFIQTNPGFQSRFNRYIQFADYSATELFAIFESLCAKLEYKLTDDAANKLKSVLENRIARKDETFGNGRFVRNLFEKALERQANRLASLTQLDKDVLTTLTAEDIPA